MEHLDQKKKIVIMIAVMSAMLFAALNQTIVGTSLPRIVSDLGGMKYYSWVFTIFMLASSITAILVGKLSDIYGRKIFILIGIGIFTLGSFLCGLSQTIFHLIAFRGIQGFGAGMIISTSFTSIGDLFSPRERGKWQGMMSSIFGLASVFGPTFGGWIVDHTDWHWIFWVFLPFGLIAFGMIFFLFPKHVIKEKEPIDYLGSILLSLIIIPFLLALTWGGDEYQWLSFPILGLGVVALLALAFFIIVENRTKSPVLPLFLFKNSIFSLSNMIGMCMGAGMFGTIMFMPFFVQGVLGTSATKSGLVMMVLTLSMVMTSPITGQLITKTGKYKRYALLGLVVMTSGLFLLSMMNENTSDLTAALYLIIVGGGLGMCLPIFTLTVQNAVSHQYLGVATASSQLFRQLGGAIGVAIMGTIMNSKLSEKMLSEKNSFIGNVSSDDASKLKNIANPQLLMNPHELEKLKASLPSEMQDLMFIILGHVRDALSYALSYVFIFNGIVVLFGFLLTFLLKEIPLRKSNRSDTAEQSTEELSSTVGQ